MIQASNNIKDSVIRLNQCLSKVLLYLLISFTFQKANPVETRDEIQNLESLLINLNEYYNISTELELMKHALENVQLGLQSIMAFSAQPSLCVLLDGPNLFPMLLGFIKSPWLTTGISYISFGIIYNLCHLNLERLNEITKHQGIKALVEYSRFINLNLENDSEQTRKKRNLLLTLFYRLGSNENVFQNEFISQGGYAQVLEYLESGFPHSLVFVGNLIKSNSPPEIFELLINSKQFLNLLDSLLLENPPQNLATILVQILRNLAQMPKSSSFLLPLLPRFLIFDYETIDDILSLLSNLSITNAEQVDWLSLWRNKFFETLFRKIKILIINLIEQSNAKVSKSTHDDKNYNYRKSVIARMTQVLKQKSCFDSISYENNSYLFTIDHAQIMFDIIEYCKDIFSKNFVFARIFSQYLSFVKPSLLTLKSELILDKNHLVEIDKSEIFSDGEIKFNNLFPPGTTKNPFLVMWRRYSSLEPSWNLEMAKNDSQTVKQGELNNNAMICVISSLNRNNSFFEKMIKIPDNAKNEIKVLLFDFKILNEWKHITIDNFLPCYVWGRQLTCLSYSSQQPWLPLLEKAVAKFLGSYKNLNKLSLEDSFLILTGKKPFKTKLPNESSKILSFFKSITEKTNFIILSINSEENFVFDKIDDDKNIIFYDAQSLLKKENIYKKFSLSELTNQSYFISFLDLNQ